MVPPALTGNVNRGLLAEEEGFWVGFGNWQGIFQVEKGESGFKLKEEPSLVSSPDAAFLKLALLPSV